MGRTAAAPLETVCLTLLLSCTRRCRGGTALPFVRSLLTSKSLLIDGLQGCSTSVDCRVAAAFQLRLDLVSQAVLASESGPFAARVLELELEPPVMRALREREKNLAAAACAAASLPLWPCT